MDQNLVQPAEAELSPANRKRDETRGEKGVATRVVSRKGKSALVEWRAKDGRVTRAHFPLKVADGRDEMSLSELAKGSPVGVDWREMIGALPTPQRIADGLWKAGIFTFDDVRENPRAVEKVFTKAGNDIKVAFFRAVKAAVTKSRR